MMRIQPITTQARLENFRIHKLQSLNCYHEILKRLTRGDSARSVALWAQTLRVDGPSGRWSWREWHKYILALAKQVEKAKEKIIRDTPKIPGIHPKPLPEPEHVGEVLDAEVSKITFRDCVPNATRDIYDHVVSTCDEISAERLLKVSAVIQLQRVSEMREMESQLKILMPNGHRTLDSMTRTLEALVKHELGKKWMRGRYGEQPVIDVNQPVSEIAQGMAQFDEVDRNLMVEAVDTTIALLAEVVGGRDKIGGLAADAGGEAAAPQQEP